MAVKLMLMVLVTNTLFYSVHFSDVEEYDDVEDYDLQSVHHSDVADNVIVRPLYPGDAVYVFDSDEDDDISQSLFTISSVDHWSKDNIVEFSSGFEKKKQLNLDYRNITQLNNDDFLSVTKLNGLSLRHNKINKIEANAFNSLVELESLKLSVNNLTKLDAVTFQNTSELLLLDLNQNKLTYLPDGLFDNLRKLENLFLSDNRLTEISGLIFRNLQNVTSIYLANNKIIKIHPNAFNNTKKLHYLYLNGNQLTSGDGKLPFLVHLNELYILNLQNNNLTRIPAEVNSFNSSCKVYLRFNQISIINLSDLREGKSLRINLDLDGDPLKCDYGIVDFLNGASYTDLASRYRKLNDEKSCSEDFIEVTSIPKPNCPDNCECMNHNDKLNKNVGDYVSITCSGRRLTTVPDNVELQNATTILFDISKNSLTELPKWPNNSNVTFIQASHNKISKIEVENLPFHLRGLDVSHNNILRIAANVVDLLSEHQNLKFIVLIENRFECVCWFEDDTEKLIDFAQQHKSITDIANPKCVGDYVLSIEDHRKYCKTKAVTLVVIISIIIASVLIVTMVFLFYKHQQFIKVWLYAHKFCLWWVDEEYLDRDLEFDAFISYAQKDVLYVHRLMTELENGTPSYKLFVHDRDFIVGEGIETQIQSSVKRCRRTIIILTNNFIASPWATHEFHCAYRRSVEEKRNCLIVVKHGDIGDSKQLDEIIRSYIQTYTYIDSSDKWFWEKIRYSLPHKRVE